MIRIKINSELSRWARKRENEKIRPMLNLLFGIGRLLQTLTKKYSAQKKPTTNCLKSKMNFPIGPLKLQPLKARAPLLTVLNVMVSPVRFSKVYRIVRKSETPDRSLLFVALCALLLLAAGCGNTSHPAGACADVPKALDLLESFPANIRYGFYTDFKPISYADTQDPDNPAFDSPKGYEPDLVEAAARLSHNRLRVTPAGIGTPFSGIWLKSASGRFDIVGGGITALEERRFDPDDPETPIITFGTSHVRFRQSLLVRADSPIMSHDDLDSSTSVGVLRDTTGESQMLRLTGITDAEGYVRSGTVITLGDDSGAGSAVTAGERSHRITSSSSTEGIRNRTRLQAPGDDVPLVVYLSSQAEQIAAVADGDVDAAAGSEIGYLIATRASGGRLRVTAVDTENPENGAFSYPNTQKGDRLRLTMDTLINCLTDGGEIGFARWHENPQVFLERAQRYAPD